MDRRPYHFALAYSSPDPGRMSFTARRSGDSRVWPQMSMRRVPMHARMRAGTLGLRLIHARRRNNGIAYRSAGRDPGPVC